MCMRKELASYSADCSLMPNALMQPYHLTQQKCRVGHCVLSHSERPGLSRSFKERSVLSRSFFEFLATYETQKNVKNVPFFCKERERTQRSSRSFIKNGKERENVPFFFNIYI